MQNIILKQDEYIMMGESRVFNELPTLEAFKELDGMAIIANHDNGNAYIIGSGVGEGDDQGFWLFDLIEVDGSCDPDPLDEFDSYQDLFNCFCNKDYQPE